MSSLGKLAQENITSWASKDGSFKRLPSSFRSQTVEPTSGRYHLYVSAACPWAHRTMIVRKLKGLEKHIGLSVVHPHMGTLGWSFGAPVRDGNEYSPAQLDKVGAYDGITGVDKDPQYNFNFIRQLYFEANKDYEGRFTVPILWDVQEHTIVNNESSEIIRILNTQFNAILEPEFAAVDLYPEALREEIDAQGEWVYPTVNNGVYRSGFASNQSAYEEAVVPLFESLDRLEEILVGKDYVVGNTLTEADIRLFTTLVRFDPVYHGHFKTNIGSIRHNYPNLNRWMRTLYWERPSFEETTNFEHIKHHYYTSHPQINPTRVVPVGPLPPIEPPLN